MKKLLLSATLVLSALLGKAQFPTIDFGMQGYPSQWSSMIGEPKQPRGWISANALSNAFVNPSNPTSVFIDSLSNAHTGYSMKITTVKLATNPVHGTPPSGLPDTVGLAMVGTVQAIPSLSIRQGTGYAGRPTYMTFWYKSAPMAGDTCGASFTFWKWDGSVRRPVAYGEFKTGATVTAMTQATVTMTYDPIDGWMWPDSASFVFGSSFRTGLKYPVIGSTMWVDDISWGPNLITGVADNAAEVTKVSLYPNPATSQVTIETNQPVADRVYIYDVTGKQIASELLDDGKATINTSGFSTGLYIYRIIGRDKQILYTKKFNVTH